MAWTAPLPHTPTKDYKGKGLQGYNIYIAFDNTYEFYSLTNDTFYIVDTIGWNAYYVTAVYEDYEPSSDPIFGPQYFPEIPGETNIIIFPNPCNENLKVKSDHPLQSLKLFNTRGEMVLNNACKANEIDINTSPFPSGIYFLKITTANTSILKKLIIYH